MYTKKKRCQIAMGRYLDNKKLTAMVLLDISKAFDNDDHALMISEMQELLLHVQNGGIPWGIPVTIGRGSERAELIRTTCCLPLK